MVWGLVAIDRLLVRSSDALLQQSADYVAAVIGNREQGIGNREQVRAGIVAAERASRRPPKAIVVVAGADTVAADDSSIAIVKRMEPMRRPLQLADGRVATVLVVDRVSTPAPRTALWVAGILGILLLGVGVARERGHSLQVAARSADIERLSIEALRANAMKSEFLANVSHELRTPLTAIVGFVEMLRDGVYGDLASRQIGPVDRIAASATHLRHLVDQILDIARIAAGRLEVSRELISLRPYVLNIASELESLFSERSLRLSISVPSTLPRVRTDPTHLRHILVNLLGNAAKYTPSGGVAVRGRLVNALTATRATPDDPVLFGLAPNKEVPWVAIQVVDSGVGVPETDRERIFDEFEQVNAGPRTDSVERGTGLGLAISRRLARSLGGEITLESQVGKGSTFTVWIPVDAADLSSVALPEVEKKRSLNALNG
jgi:signal transduction histidine kinase